MDIYGYLKLDHAYVTQLFKQFEKVNSFVRRQQIVDVIAQELLVHLRSEQETFYKVLMNFDITKELTQHGKKEHQEIEEHINFIKERRENENVWVNKVYALKKIVDHHVHEEEHKVFKKAKDVLSKEDAIILKEKMHYLKGQLILKLKKNNLHLNV